MSAPFQSSLNPFGSQAYTPSSTAYGSGAQDPNPNPMASSASNPLGWANQNTYAPWATPDGSTGANSSFSGYGAPSYHAPDADGWNGFGSSNLFGGMFGMAKKRSSPDFSAPSYQGTLFDPGGSYLSSVGLSAQGEAANQANAQQMPGNSSANQNAGQQPQFASGSNYSNLAYPGAGGLSSSQSYIGQNPYSLAGNSYIPGQSGTGLSYGGYSSYGGYGNSNSGMQPYVPGQ